MYHPSLGATWSLLLPSNSVEPSASRPSLLLASHWAPVPWRLVNSFQTPQDGPQRPGLSPFSSPDRDFSGVDPLLRRVTEEINDIEVHYQSIFLTWGPWVGIFFVRGKTSSVCIHSFFLATLCPYSFFNYLIWHRKITKNLTVFLSSFSVVV